MWIMLTHKLPTSPSPPKLSIFWSVENHRQYKGKDWGDHKNGRWINFAGENILVLEHEFSVVKPENMKLYVAESHEFMPDGVVAEMLMVNAEINSDNRDIYGSALLDGCTHQQALMVLANMDITIDDSEFPPIGWYRIRKEYGLIWADEWELVENRMNEQEFLGQENSKQELEEDDFYLDQYLPKITGD